MVKAHVLGQVPSQNSLQVMNTILRQKLKESRKVNAALSNKIAQLTQKYQVALDQLVDEVVRLETNNSEARLTFELLWEKFQVEKMASIERRKMLTQLRRDHAEELSRMRDAMPKTPNSVRMGNELASALQPEPLTLYRKVSPSSEHDDFEALLDSALEITGSGYESPKLPSNTINFPDDAELERNLLPRRGSFEQHQEEAVMRARLELFKQPPAELPFNVLANLIDVEPESKGGKTKTRRLSLKEPHRLKALEGLVNSSESLFADLDDSKWETLGTEELFESNMLDNDRLLLRARDSVEVDSSNIPEGNTASRSSYVHQKQPRTQLVNIIPEMEFWKDKKAQDEKSKKDEEEKLSQDEVPLLEDTESYDNEQSSSLVRILDVPVGGLLQTEEKVDVIDLDGVQDCSMILPSDLKVKQERPNGVSTVIPLLEMDSSAILKLLRDGSSLFVNLPNTQVLHVAQNEKFDDNASSDASEETPFVEIGSMRSDVPDWIRRTYSDVPYLEISDPIMATIMPTVIVLVLQRVLSLSVKVKQTPERLMRDDFTTRRKRSHSAANPYNGQKKARGRRKKTLSNVREPALSMNPAMRYNASTRGSPLYIQKYRRSIASSPKKGTLPHKVKRPKTVLILPNNTSLGYAGNEFNPNHNKQRVASRRESPNLSGSNNSQSRSWQRPSDNELKHSSENPSSEKANRRRARVSSMRKRNRKNTKKDIKLQDECSEPLAQVETKRSNSKTGGFFSKFR